MESKELLVNISEQNLFIIYFVVGLILISWLNVMDGKKIRLYFQACLQSRFTDQLERKEQARYNRLNLISRIFYFINLSMIVYKLNDLLGYTVFTTEGISLMGLIIVVVILWYGVKYLLVGLIGWIYNLAEVSSENNFNNQLNMVVLGLLLFPILIISHFQVYFNELIFMSLCISLLVLGSILRNRRLFLISYNKFGVPVYYNILYICTLEILPLVVLVKLLSGKM